MMSLCMYIFLLQCAAHLNLGHVIRVMNPSSKSTTTTISSTTLSATIPSTTLSATTSTLSAIDSTSSTVSTTNPDVSGGFNIGTMFKYCIAEHEVDWPLFFDFLRENPACHTHCTCISLHFHRFPLRRKSQQSASINHSLKLHPLTLPFSFDVY